MVDAAESGSNDDLGLTGNWYRPWWKWAIALALFFTTPSGVSPTNSGEAIGVLVGAVLGLVLLVYIGTAVTRALKKMIRSIRNPTPPDGQSTSE